MNKESSLIKSTFIIMMISIISKALGLVRDILIGKNFGAGMYTDAYNIAVTIPETIFALIGLAISTAFLPMLSKIRAKKGKDEMWTFANNVINILFIISLVFFAVTSVFSKEIVHILAKGLNGEAATLTVSLTRITLLNILFLSINACFTSMLQVNEDFVIPSILGLFFNLPMIVYLLLFKGYDITGLTIANVIGNLFRVLVQIPSLIKHGYKYKFFIDLKDSRLKEIIIIILPVIVSAGANSLNLIVDKNIASSLPQGSISALDYGQKLILFINATIVTSIANVSYPMMANMRNEGNREGFISILKRSLIYLAILLIPITIGMMVFGRSIIEIVYGRGKFDSAAISITTLALTGYSVGIFFTGIRDILNSTLFSMGKTKITTVNGIIGVIFNIILSITLSKKFGIFGVAIASSIAMIITSILLLNSIRKIENNFKIMDIIKKVGILIVISLTMGVIIVGVQLYLANKINTMMILIIGTIIGIVVYFALCYILKIEEILEIKDLILKKLRINKTA